MSDSSADVVMNVIDGSDEDENESDNNDVVFVPALHTITRHGRVAGTWTRNFEAQLSETEDEDEDENSSEDENDAGRNSKNDKREMEKNKCTFTTRSGRKAGTWRRFDI